jgi:hypothetical protein
MILNIKVPRREPLEERRLGGEAGLHGLWREHPAHYGLALPRRTCQTRLPSAPQWCHQERALRRPPPSVPPLFVPYHALTTPDALPLWELSARCARRWPCQHQVNPRATISRCLTPTAGTVRHHLTGFSQTDRAALDQSGRSAHPVTLTCGCGSWHTDWTRGIDLWICDASGGGTLGPG